MAQKLPSIYANVVAIRATDHELVLEFGSSFPEPGKTPASSDYSPDVRVVLPISGLSGLIDTMKQLLQQKQQTATTMIDKKPL